mmetsp:Transcript_16583/g.47315  ORF Transcript_16583/g.47315 Transcript_16583/m.47315 type:complete len:200 (+) Transcript_16583:440-1039(+)
MSRLCTSITTNPPSVPRSSLGMSPRTVSTTSSNSSTRCDRTAAMAGPPPFSIAASMAMTQVIWFTVKIVWPGQFRSHCLRSILKNSSVARSMDSASDFFMIVSTSTSHFSTLPPLSLGLIILWSHWSYVNSNLSPFGGGASNAARMFKSGSKSRCAIPSKHFFMWGWTFVGSFVSARISRSSSLDRKKNLGKASLFVSR